jgi:hypothetical protein
VIFFSLIGYLNNMNNINIQYYKTKIGELILGSSNQKLCLLDYRYRKTRQRVDDRLQKVSSREIHLILQPE